MERESFVFYRSFYNMASMLPKEEKLAFYEALMVYGLDGSEIAENEFVRALMEGVKPLVDKAQKRYQANVENGKKGGRPKIEDNPTITENNPIETQNNPPKPNPNLNEDVNEDVNDNDNDNVKRKESRAKFHPPSAEEVKEYCEERKNKVDPNTFIDFYESKGWFVGKNKMKDWKAAVRSWERRGNTAAAGQNGKDHAPAKKTNRFVNYEQRDDCDFDELERQEREYIKRKLEENNA